MGKTLTSEEQEPEKPNDRKRRKKSCPEYKVWPRLYNVREGAGYSLKDRKAGCRKDHSASHHCPACVLLSMDKSCD